ncbi:glycoprotein precursor [Nyando virus]|uniref:Envelopment polyprotein n=1 Tax=Nyando virus TaxID=35316 RepID=A0A088MFP7_9VIRU|nr:glycoprotein precursor [Nyando virus]AIN37030.1 glycoprotein precursor [Nyando virus]
MIVFILCSLAMVNAMPYERCFEGGTLIKDIPSQTGIGNACLKDDVSILKVESIPFSNATGIFARNKISRKWIIQNWSDCSPRKVDSGNINVVEIHEDLTLHSSTYACTSECLIGMDKETGQVVLTTDKLNRFEIIGTTRRNGWFKTKTYVTLDQTCEHIKVICGMQSIQMHACFKHHMPCIRFFKHTILPDLVSTSVCENLEIIILTILALLIFVLLNIIMKTYICYLMLPLFVPFAYTYGYLYNKISKKCQSCGLAYHPFTKCSNHCVCGSLFETSDRMRLHRESGMCQGYKSMRTARVLCKSKGSASILSIITAILLLSFVTPINSIIIKEDYVKTNDSDIFDEYQIFKKNNENNHLMYLTRSVIDAIFVPVIMLIYTLIMFLRHKFYSWWVMDCNECDMYHDVKNIKYNGDFTNKCNTCTCGFSVYTNGNYHLKSGKCLYKYESRLIRRMIILITVLYILKDPGFNVAAETFDTCYKKQKLEKNCININRDFDCTQEHRPIGEIADELINQKYILDIEKPWVVGIGGKPETLNKALTSASTYHSLLLVEEILYRYDCKYFQKLNTINDDSEYKWRLILHSTLAFCNENKDKHPCPCILTKSCAVEMSTNTELQTYYNSKDEELNSDLNALFNILFSALPGTVQQAISDNLREKKYNEVKSILELIIAKVQKNVLFKSICQFIKFAMDITLTNYNPNGRWYKAPLKDAASILTTKVSGSNPTADLKNAKVGEMIDTCKKLKIIHCISPRHIELQLQNVLCEKSEGKYLYETGLTNKIYKKYMATDDYCLKDVHCIANFTPSTQEKLEKLQTLTCGWTEPLAISDEYTKPARSCRFKNKGTCAYGKFIWNTALCQNGQYYYVDQEGMHASSDDVGVMCLSDDCTEKRYPVHPDNLKNCQWLREEIKNKEVAQWNHDTIESYKRSLAETIQHNLEIHHYSPTKNYPHVKPSYMPILLQGLITEEGMESTFIEFELPALTGESVGFKVNSPDGTHIFDAIVYIKTATIGGTYDYLYSTGPTIAINIAHDEKCTGPCPEEIPKKGPNWLTFSQERTSRWGCEEWMCAAINTGCVFGSCQDVIKEDMRVYKKSTSETTKIEICITLITSTYCINIDALQPIISDVFDIQFKTVETQNLPNIIGIRDHSVFTGSINDIGSLAKGCGNVQKRNESTVGSGDPRFDYICHATSRKDVIVRKCFDNHYDACKFLKKESKYVILDEHSRVRLSNPNNILGTIKAKIKFGDVKYKLSQPTTNLEYTATCVGCTNCLENIVCSINIEVESEQICGIESTCELYSSRALLKPQVRNYNIKMTCRETITSIDIEICKNKKTVQLSKVPGSTNLELKGIDQASYIKEVDDRCGTWMCKVFDEGFLSLFKPLFNWLGEAGIIAAYSIITLISLIFIIKVGVPLTRFCTGLLKKQDLEYALDTFKSK